MFEKGEDLLASAHTRWAVVGEPRSQALETDLKLIMTEQEMPRMNNEGMRRRGTRKIHREERYLTCHSQAQMRPAGQV